MAMTGPGGSPSTASMPSSPATSLDSQRKVRERSALPRLAQRAVGAESTGLFISCGCGGPAAGRAHCVSL
jgi:hypothetical protein